MIYLHRRRGVPAQQTCARTRPTIRYIRLLEPTQWRITDGNVGVFDGKCFASALIYQYPSRNVWKILTSEEYPIKCFHV